METFFWHQPTRARFEHLGAGTYLLRVIERPGSQYGEKLLLKPTSKLSNAQNRAIASLLELFGSLTSLREPLRNHYGHL